MIYLSLSLFLAAGALEDLAFERREVHQRSHEADAELSLLRRKAHEKDQACTAHDVGVPRSVGAGDVGDVAAMAQHGRHGLVFVFEFFWGRVHLSKYFRVFWRKDGFVSDNRPPQLVAAGEKIALQAKPNSNKN